MTESTPPHRESLTPAQTTTQSNRFWAHPVFHTSQWPMVAVTSGAVVVGASIATGVSWLLGRIMFGALSDAWPNWLVPGPASGDEGWLAPIKVALTVAAGVGAAVALVVAYRKQRLAERAEPRDVAADQRERERSYRDRYASATEQLGSSNSTVRLAGVYALANLADQWLEGRHQCVEVLCSHLRVPWSPEGTVGESTITLQQPSVSGGTRTTTYIATPGELEVRKTILRLIGRHLLPDHLRAADNASWSTIPLDLQGAHLPALDWRNCQIPKIDFIGAEFIGDAKFDNATFAGDVDFVGYSGFEGRASPGGIWFREDAGFNHATFSKTASFNGATFDGGAWFVGATFASESKFNDVKFRGGAGFDGATFTEVAWFDDVAVTGDTGFVMATFQNTARFDNGRFSGTAHSRQSLRAAPGLGTPHSPGRAASDTSCSLEAPHSNMRRSRGRHTSCRQTSPARLDSTQQPSRAMPGSSARPSEATPGLTMPRLSGARAFLPCCARRRKDHTSRSLQNGLAMSRARSARSCPGIRVAPVPSPRHPSLRPNPNRLGNCHVGPGPGASLIFAQTLAPGVELWKGLHDLQQRARRR